jgi:hypothetical protein
MLGERHGRTLQSGIVTAPAWLDELDLHAGPPAAAMGTRTLDDGRWLLVDDDWIGQRDEARALLRERRDDVLAPSAVAPVVEELAGRIDRWLATHHPELADDAHAGEADPLAAARLRVAEDLCVLVPGGGGWILESGAVCFPSYWRLRDKVGRPLGFVHEPVPGYPGPFAARVDTFLGRLRPGQGVWRRNWSIHRRPDLFAPTYERVDQPPPAERWLRTEHQTLLRLEEHDAVVFAIRTQQVPIARLRARPDIAAALAAALRGWSDEQRAYKGAAVDDALLAWLAD